MWWHNTTTLQTDGQTETEGLSVRPSVVVLCDTHDTTILIVDTSRRYRRYLRDDTTAVYRSSKKYRETAQVSWVSRYRIQLVPLGNECASLRYRNELNSHGKAMSALAAVTKYAVSYFFAISSVCAALAY